MVIAALTPEGAARVGETSTSRPMAGQTRRRPLLALWRRIVSGYFECPAYGGDCTHCPAIARRREVWTNHEVGVVSGPLGHVTRRGGDDRSAQRACFADHGRRAFIERSGHDQIGRADILQRFDSVELP